MALNTATQPQGIADDKPLLKDAAIAVIIVVKGEIKSADMLSPDDRHNCVDAKTKISGSAIRLCHVTSDNGGRWTVAIAYLAVPGNNHAARLVTELKYTIGKKLQYVIMCGIAGAVPLSAGKYDRGLRPGDLVASDVDGVLQYDFGDETLDHLTRQELFAIKASKIGPTTELRSIVAQFRAHDGIWQTWLKEKLEQPAFKDLRPPKKPPMFIREEIDETTGLPPLSLGKRFGRFLGFSGKPTSATGAAFGKFKEYSLNAGESPRLLRGVIGSANRVLMNPTKRDALYSEHKIVAVDMESAGVAEAATSLKLEYLIVRGIADFCDGKKAANWQHYAGAVAAAFTRAVIAKISGADSYVKATLTPEGKVELSPDVVPDALAQAMAEQGASPDAGATTKSGLPRNPERATAATVTTPPPASATEPLTTLAVEHAIKEIRRLEGIHEFHMGFEVAERLARDLSTSTMTLDRDLEWDALYAIATMFTIESRGIGGDAGRELAQRARDLMRRAEALNG